MAILRARAPKRGLRPGLLDGLGLVGFGDIEPVVIAAVAAELPILLVGPHGTGKSLLLIRIAEALGLAWRHYNASLLSYDDLVGYPVPDGHGGLDWLRTPATIWDAEAVFLDEIKQRRRLNGLATGRRQHPRRARSWAGRTVRAARPARLLRTDGLAINWQQT